MAALSQLGTTAAKYWWVLLVRGILLIALGLIFVAWPDETLVVFIAFFAAYLLVDGVITIVQGLTDRTGGQSRLWHLVLGGLSIVAAAIVYIWPGATILVLVFLVGFWAIIAGVAAIAGGLQLRRTPGSGWGWLLAWGILALLFGISLIVNPGAGILSLLWIVSVWAIASGITLIMFSFVVRKAGTTLVAGR